MDNLEYIYKILPDPIAAILKYHVEKRGYPPSEIRLRINKPLIFVYDEENNVIHKDKKAYIVKKEEIDLCFMKTTNFSAYAYEEELKNGYITIKGGHRIGICGKMNVKQGKIMRINDISFINIRVANEINNCSVGLISCLFENEKLLNTLIVSPPGSGKTTLLRDLIKNVSDGNYMARGQTVGVVDERSEICACVGGVPCNDVGINTDVISNCSKPDGINILLRTMAPRVIAVDEIGSENDEKAVKEAVRCGVSVIATCHGGDITDVKLKGYTGIFGRIILIGKYREKRVYEIYDENERLIKNVNEDHMCHCNNYYITGNWKSNSI